jgi:hypothetical protein
LKEYELAVDKLEEGPKCIVPVLVGGYVSADGAEMLKKISGFGGLKGKKAAVNFEHGPTSTRRRAGLEQSSRQWKSSSASRAYTSIPSK